MAGTRNSPMKPSVDPAMTTDEEVVVSKRRKIDDSAEEAEAANSSTAVASATAAAVAPATTTTSAANMMETIDVANMLGVKPGDRIEVKWNINEEEDEEDAPPPTADNNAVEGERLGLPKTEGEDEPVAAELPLKSTTDEKEQGNNNINIDSAANTSNINSNASSPAPPGMISVWWKATIQKATGQYHILDDADEAVQRNDDSSFKAVVQPTGAIAGDSITTSTDKNQTYNCPKCTKVNMSKQGLYTHYGMVHGGKLSRDYPNLLSNQQLEVVNSNNNNNGATAAASSTSAMPKVRIPIYEITYDPLPSLGFPEYSHEEVAFISNVTLLNLSSEEMMNFRKEGEVHSPDVVVGVDGTEEGVKGETEDVGGAAAAGGELTSIFATAATKPPPPSTNPNDIYKEFRSEDDIRSYMNELMQKSMISTGMNEKMKVLPRSQQNVIAGRINKALEGLLGKMMEEVGKVEGGGQRVVTAEVVKRCMEQMRPV